jgi:hypothetical protein
MYCLNEGVGSVPPLGFGWARQFLSSIEGCAF